MNALIDPLMGLFMFTDGKICYEIVTNSSQISFKEGFFDADQSKSVLIIDYESYANVFTRLVFNKAIFEGCVDIYPF